MDEIIDVLGGTTKLAKKLNVSKTNVSMWRIRGIPWRWRPTIAKMAKARKIKLPKDFLDPRAA